MHILEKVNFVFAHLTAHKSDVIRTLLQCSPEQGKAMMGKYKINVNKQWAGGTNMLQRERRINHIN